MLVTASNVIGVAVFIVAVLAVVSVVASQDPERSVN